MDNRQESTQVSREKAAAAQVSERADGAVTGVTFPLGVPEIERLIPHRYPFLLVDRVTEFEALKRIVGIKNVTTNEPFFTGHFPGRPIMPGVLILEALAQMGALFAKLCKNKTASEGIILFAGADDVRFRRPVVPGDTLTLVCDDVQHRSGHWKLRGVAYVGEERAAEAVLKAVEVA